MVAVGTSLKLADSTDVEWAALDALLPWAEALGGVRLRVFDGGTHGSAEEIAAMAARLVWWTRRRERERLQSSLIVETHDSLLTIAKIGALLAAAPGTRLLWDSHHTWRRGSENPLMTWRAIAPHVAHIHVKDSATRPEWPTGFAYTRPGEGEFPAEPLFAALRAEFAGPVSFEWEKHWHPSLPPLETALADLTARGWW